MVLFTLNVYQVGALKPSEKYESQLGWLFPVYGKIKHVPNHQPGTIGYSPLNSVCVPKRCSGNGANPIASHFFHGFFSLTCGEATMFMCIPTGKLTELWKITIYGGFSHSKWWSSVVTLVYQRVDAVPQGFPIWLFQHGTTPAPARFVSKATQCCAKTPVTWTRDWCFFREEPPF